MLKAFQRHNYNSIIIIVVTLILLWLSSILKHTPFDISSEQINAPLYNVFLNTFAVGKKNLLILTFIIFIVQAIIINFFANKYKLFGQESFMILLVYILLGGYFLIQKISAVFFANIFLLIAIELLIQTNFKKQSLIKYLNASVLLAISSLFYFPYFFFIIFALIAVIIIRSKITREFFVVIFGFVITYIFFFEVHYLIYDKLPSLEIFWNSLSSKEVKFHNNIPEKIYFSFLFIVFIFSNIKIMQSIRTRMIEIRTIFQLLFFFFLFTALLFITIPSIGTSFFITIAIPLSFLYSYFFISLKNNRKNKFLFFLFFIAPFIYQLSLVS